MSNFVLVPGGCHGGWWYQPVVDHSARMATRREHSHSPAWAKTSKPARSTWIATSRRPRPPSSAAEQDGVVLVGHSYAGSVITGVADQVPERIRALVYLDAFVPEDGDSCFAMVNDELRRWYIEGAADTGLAVAPMPFFDTRAKPHPVATLLQRIRLTGAWRSVPVKHYVAAQWPDRSPLADTIERVRADPGWTVHDWPTSHNVMHDGPDRVFELIANL